MTLYKQWIKLMEDQTEETFEDFWKEYSQTETRIYEHILSHKDEHLAGSFDELVKKFDANPVIFMGFLDGINTSLNTANQLEDIKEAIYHEEQKTHQEPPVPEREPEKPEEAEERREILEDEDFMEEEPGPKRRKTGHFHAFEIVVK